MRPLVGVVLLALGLFAVAVAGMAVAIALTVGMTFGMLWPFGRRWLASGSEARGAGPLSISDALEHCEDGIVFTDPMLKVWYANAAFTGLCGSTSADTTLDATLAPRIVEADEVAHAFEELKVHVEREGEGALTHVGASTRAFEWRSVPLRHADGTVAGRAFVFRDRSQAQELAGLKSDFLSTVTHELRTPLTSVKGSLQLVLGKSSALSPIDCELLNISLKNADRLIRLINDLLDISRLELGKIELTFAKVPTASLVDEAVAGLRSYAAGREITIEAQTDGDVPALDADRDRLIQVLTNLISNAVKFSPAQGRVVVRATHVGGEVAIAVRDWGIGIRAADQERLFRRFQRLNPGHSDEPGTGLGLAISKAIVERHGGRIAVASAEQEGSTFTVLIPAGAETAESAAAEPADPSDPTTPTVLLVDDDEELGALLRQAWGDRYRVLQITRGAEALDTTRALRPDVVLLDVVLPDLSGYDVLRILHQTGTTAATPVVMLTVQPEHALATNLGALDVVGKPIDMDRLRGAIERALRESPQAAAAALRAAM